jgi:hypothetical protein
MEEYSTKPEEEAKKSAYEQGQEFAKIIIERMNIEERDINGIVKVLRIIFTNVPSTPFEVEGNRVHLKNEGFCPLMAICLEYNLPWEKMCKVMGWPFFHGLATAIDPKAEFNVIKSRHRGDSYCDHIFEIK